MLMGERPASPRPSPTAPSAVQRDPPTVPRHSLMVSVAGALAGGCRSRVAELGPGPGVRESRGGEAVEGLAVGALAGGSVCVAEGRAASAAGLLLGAIPSTTRLPTAPNHVEGQGSTKRHRSCTELRGDSAILGPSPAPFLLCPLHPSYAVSLLPSSGANA